MQETLLELKDARVVYGGVVALDHVTVNIDEGEVVALMGPNGAGKSTVFKAIMGLAPLEEGEVLWRGAALDPVPYEMAERGIVYVPQGRQVFKHLSVKENLELGGYALKVRSDAARNIESTLKFFPALKEKFRTPAGLLSGGQQQMLTIARGLVADPTVMLLDEPSLGLSPKIVREVFALIKQINKERDIAMLVVEHSIKSVLEIADRAYVLARGRVAIEKHDGAMLADSTLEKVFLA